MATADSTIRTAQAESRLHTGSVIMVLAGLGFVGYGVIFFVRNFTGAFLELGIGHEQVNVDKQQIQRFSPELEHYISHLHIALSGFIIATGVAIAALAWYGVRRGVWWAWVTAVVVPLIALVVALPAHYPWGFATLGHLGLVYLDVLVLGVGAGIAYAGFRSRGSSP